MEPPISSRIWLASGRSWLYLTLLAAAAAVWVLGVRTIQVSQLGSLGLAALLPAPAVLAAMVLMLSFWWAVWAPRWPEWVPAVTLVLVVVLLFGLTAMTETEARFAAVWRHIGYTDYIIRHRSVDGGLAAYFNWPGFFILLATLTRLAGVPSLLGVANWAPVFFNLIYLPPLYLIFASLTADRRVRWLGLGLFYLDNWIDQDYLSPQAFAFFLYLVGLGVLLRWFGIGGRRLSWLAVLRAPLTTQPGRDALLLGVFLLIFGAVVISHPLTPAFGILAVGALVLMRRGRPWWLPLLMLTMTAGWVAFMAQDYLSGNLGSLTGSVGQVGSTLQQSLQARLVGGTGHVAVVLIRVAMAAAIWLLASFGAYRSVRRRADAVAVALAAVPLIAVLLQGYGGEILLRVQLFALPFLAFLAARALSPFPLRLGGWRQAAAVAAVPLLLLGGFLFAKFGNEQQDRFSPAEVLAANRIYELAPPGSVLIYPVGDGQPNQQRDIESYGYAVLDPSVVSSGNVQAVAAEMRAALPARSFLTVSRSEIAFADNSSGLPPGSLERLRSRLEGSPEFEVVYSNPDAQIFTLRPPPVPPPPSVPPPLTNGLVGVPGG